MEKDFFQDKLKKLVQQRNTLLVPLVALSFAVIFLSSALKGKEERVVIVPTTGVPFWIEKACCSPEYLRSFGLYLSNLLFSKDKNSAPFKNNELLSHIHPQQKHHFQRVLEEEMMRMEKEDLSFAFEIESVEIQEKKQLFSCIGTQKTYLPKGDGASSEIKKVRYTLSFHMEGGKLFLTHFQKDLL